jgi:cytochrome c peroxidase
MRITFLSRWKCLAPCLLFGLFFIFPAKGEPDLSQYAKPKSIPSPAYNPPSVAKNKLGQRLFFDNQLSGNDTISCAFCHIPEFGWTDRLRFSLGENGQARPRRTPPLQDVAWNVLFARDGRVETLEGFVLGPITHPGEMNQPLNDLVPELLESDEYIALYKSAYENENISIDGFVQALASFVRTLRSATSPFDRWVAGENTALSTSAKRGFALFVGKAGCGECHSGWRFTDQQFHDIGVDTDDLGRGALETDNKLMQYAFKTPSLRNVEIRPPYMHNGTLSSLEQVIDFYVSGGVNRDSRSPLIRPLILTTHERLNLVEFLKSLTDDTRR